QAQESLAIRAVAWEDRTSHQPHMVPTAGEQHSRDRASTARPDRTMASYTGRRSMRCATAGALGHWQVNGRSRPTGTREQSSLLSCASLHVFQRVQVAKVAHVQHLLLMSVAHACSERTYTASLARASVTPCCLVG